MPGAEPGAVDRAVAPGVADLVAENARLEAELDGLHRALRGRAAIEQAKGVLMAVSRCSEAAAFGWLARLSQQRNIRVQVLAEMLLQLAATGFGVPEGEPGTVGWLRDEVLAAGVPVRFDRPPRPPAPPAAGVGPRPPRPRPRPPGPR